MPSKKQLAESAIQNAFAGMRLGKKQVARWWAHRAISLDPELEDPWLILAALAGPRAGLEYIKQALTINPGSQRARRGLLAIQNQLEEISKVGTHTSPRQEGEVNGLTVEKVHQAGASQYRHDETAQGRSPSQQNWSGIFPTVALAIILIMILFVAASRSGIVKANELPASVQKLMVLQFFSNPTATMTETKRPTDAPTASRIPSDTPSPSLTATTSPTLTDTPSPTATPTPTDTPTPNPTDTPSPTPSPEPALAEAAAEINPPLEPALANMGGEKRVLVSISQQRLDAYEGDTLVYRFIVSTGANNGTRIGTYSILDKIPRAWSDPWGFWMPDWLGIYWVGYTENGIHALPELTNGNVIWGDGLGTPISHGCVVLSTADAQLLYDWVDIGTQVEIFR
jgi:lipoprotein-anchoring transpeptidase ErfK/SrfK